MKLCIRSFAHWSFSFGLISENKRMRYEMYFSIKWFWIYTMIYILKNISTRYMSNAKWLLSLFIVIVESNKVSYELSDKTGLNQENSTLMIEQKKNYFSINVQYCMDVMYDSIEHSVHLHKIQFMFQVYEILHHILTTIHFQTRKNYFFYLQKNTVWLYRITYYQIDQQ